MALFCGVRILPIGWLAGYDSMRRTKARPAVHPSFPSHLPSSPVRFRCLYEIPIQTNPILLHVPIMIMFIPTRHLHALELFASAYLKVLVPVGSRRQNIDLLCTGTLYTPCAS
jgi:hypothetical protein